MEEQPVVTEIPKWLEIKEEDDEKTKAKKRKLLKSMKSKMRFQNMDLVQKDKQDNWKSFLQGKGSKKKTGKPGSCFCLLTRQPRISFIFWYSGFFTTTKKESIFKAGSICTMQTFVWPKSDAPSYAYRSLRVLTGKSELLAVAGGSLTTPRQESTSSTLTINLPLVDCSPLFESCPLATG